MGIFTNKGGSGSDKSSGLRVTIVKRAITKVGPTAMPDGSIIPEAFNDFSEELTIEGSSHGDQQYEIAAAVTHKLGELNAVQGRAIQESLRRHLLNESRRVTTPQQYQLPGNGNGYE